MGPGEAIERALRAHSEVHALGYVDLPSGSVLFASVRDEGAREALEVAAASAAQLCRAPRLDAEIDDERLARAAIVVSTAATHVFACSEADPSRAVVGVAVGRANVALILASLRSLAASLEEEMR